MALTSNDKKELAKLANNSSTSVTVKQGHALIGPSAIKYTTLSDIKKGGRLGS